MNTLNRVADPGGIDPESGSTSTEAPAPDTRSGSRTTTRVRIKFTPIFFIPSVQEVVTPFYIVSYYIKRRQLPGHTVSLDWSVILTHL